MQLFGLFFKTTLSKLQLMWILWVSVWKNWATFYSFWSHCSPLSWSNVSRVTRWLINFFNIRSFTLMKWYPTALNICQSMLRFLPNTEWILKSPKTVKNFTQILRNFAISSHTKREMHPNEKNEFILNANRSLWGEDYKSWRHFYLTNLHIEMQMEVLSCEDSTVIESKQRENCLYTLWLKGLYRNGHRQCDQRVLFWNMLQTKCLTYVAQTLNHFWGLF